MENNFNEVYKSLSADDISKLQRQIQSKSCYNCEIKSCKMVNTYSDACFNWENKTMVVEQYKMNHMVKTRYAFGGRMLLLCSELFPYVDENVIEERLFRFFEPTKSLAKDIYSYGLEKEFLDFIKNPIKYPEFDGYVRHEGKYYKYNTYYNGIYCCINNIVIADNGLKEFDKDKYLLFDNYLFNKETRKLVNIYDREDAFYENIKKYNDLKYNETRDLKFILNDEIKICIDEDNTIYKYYDKTLKEVKDNFLDLGIGLEVAALSSATSIGNNFLTNAYKLKRLSLENVEVIGDNALTNAYDLDEIKIPRVKKIGNDALSNAMNLRSISMPCLRKVGNNFALDAKLESIKLYDLIHEYIDEDSLNMDIRVYIDERDSFIRRRFK